MQRELPFVRVYSSIRIPETREEPRALAGDKSVAEKPSRPQSRNRWAKREYKKQRRREDRVKVQVILADVQKLAEVQKLAAEATRPRVAQPGTETRTAVPPGPPSAQSAVPRDREAPGALVEAERISEGTAHLPGGAFVEPGASQGAEGTASKGGAESAPVRGLVVGPGGPQGPEGEEGTEGTEGPEGTKGAEGTEGPKGTEGTTETEGAEGTTGTEGAEGGDGKAGAAEEGLGNERDGSAAKAPKGKGGESGSSQQSLQALTLTLTLTAGTSSRLTRAATKRQEGGDSRRAKELPEGLRDGIRAQEGELGELGEALLGEEGVDLGATYGLFSPDPEHRKFDDDPKGGHMAAVQLARQARVVEARALFRHLVARFSDNVYVLTSGGTFEARNGDRETAAWAVMEAGRKDKGAARARLLFRQATEADPSHGASWQAWAVFEHRRGEVRFARQLFEKGGQLCPRHAPLFQVAPPQQLVGESVAAGAWAMLEAELAEHKKARELFRQSVDIDPSHVHSYLAWATLEAGAGDHKRATELFQLAVESNPRHTRTYLQWGRFARAVGDDNMAREAFRLGLEQDPNNVHLAHALGQLEMDARDFPAARAALAQAYKASPNNPHILGALADLERAASPRGRKIPLRQPTLPPPPPPSPPGSPGAAVGMRALRLPPPPPPLSANEGAGSSVQDLDDMPEAYPARAGSALGAVPGLIPKRQAPGGGGDGGVPEKVPGGGAGPGGGSGRSRGSQVATSVLLRKAAAMEAAAGRPESARRFFEDAVTAAPHDGRLLRAWALLEKDCKRAPEASELFRRSAKADPNLPRTWLLWGLWELQLGHLAKSRAIFDRGLEFNPRSPYLYLAWARLEARERNSALARELFQAGCKACPRYGPLWLAWGVFEWQVALESGPRLREPAGGTRGGDATWQPGPNQRRDGDTVGDQAGVLDELRTEAEEAEGGAELASPAPGPAHVDPAGETPDRVGCGGGGWQELRQGGSLEPTPIGADDADVADDADIAEPGGGPASSDVADSSVGHSGGPAGARRLGSSDPGRDGGGSDEEGEPDFGKRSGASSGAGSGSARVGAIRASGDTSLGEGAGRQIAGGKELQNAREGDGGNAGNCAGSEPEGGGELRRKPTEESRSRASCEPRGEPDKGPREGTAHAASGVPGDERGGQKQEGDESSRGRGLSCAVPDGDVGPPAAAAAAGGGGGGGSGGSWLPAGSLEPSYEKGAQGSSDSWREEEEHLSSAAGSTPPANRSAPSGLPPPEVQQRPEEEERGHQKKQEEQQQEAEEEDQQQQERGKEEVQKALAEEESQRGVPMLTPVQRQAQAQAQAQEPLLRPEGAATTEGGKGEGGGGGGGAPGGMRSRLGQEVAFRKPMGASRMQRQRVGDVDRAAFKAAMEVFARGAAQAAHFPTLYNYWAALCFRLGHRRRASRLKREGRAKACDPYNKVPLAVRFMLVKRRRNRDF
eukprot:jgi/Mesen1/3353/ME000191S02492